MISSLSAITAIVIQATSKRQTEPDVSILMSAALQMEVVHKSVLTTGEAIDVNADMDIKH